MLKKCCLEISIKHDFTAMQGLSFPLVVILSNDNLINWYYENYMLPIARFDGVNSLSCNMMDAYTYGSGANIYGKIMRYSNVSLSFCQEIKNIVRVIKSEIINERYCILFLDFYHLNCSTDQYHQYHFVHEIMFYGYDDERQIFFCTGYMNKVLEVFELSYAEVQLAFEDAKVHINETNGWEHHMCMTLDLVGHQMQYPYNNITFYNKLKQYISGDISPECYYEQLLYLNKTNMTQVGLGVNISNIFLQYLYSLREFLESGEDITCLSTQYHAFCMYKDSHKALLDRMNYFAGQNNKENQVKIWTARYEEVVQKCNIIVMLYVKVFILLEKNHRERASSVVGSMINTLNVIYELENDILQEFLSWCCNID